MSPPANKGFEAVAVTEHDEPPAVIGSDLQKLAYPDNYKKHLSNHNELKEAYGHGGDEVLDVQARGEYLYAATGKGGLRVYDIANIDDKDISQRTITAPVSPLGQRFYVPTKYAMAVATPTTLGVDPLRTHLPENEEQPIHLIYGFLYVADKEEGLVVIGDPNLKSRSPGVGTLLNGDPNDNFLKRALAFNPNGALNGARRITIVGTYAYILCDAGLAVVNLDNPLKPELVSQIGAPFLIGPRGNCRTVPLRVRSRWLGIESSGHHSPRSPGPCQRSSSSHRRRPQHLRGPHLRLRLCRQARRGHRRYRTSRAAQARSNL